MNDVRFCAPDEPYRRQIIKDFVGAKVAPGANGMNANAIVFVITAKLAEAKHLYVVMTSKGREQILGILFGAALDTWHAARADHENTQRRPFRS